MAIYLVHMENTDCIFCKIVKGEIPSHKIYEDDNYVAFLDIEPHIEGHTLVIPKKHHRWVYDVEDIGGYWEAVKKVTNKLQEKLSPSFVSYYTYGMDVPHAHVHVLPRKSSQEGPKPNDPNYNPTNDELKNLAEKINS